MGLDSLLVKYAKYRLIDVPNGDNIINEINQIISFTVMEDDNSDILLDDYLVDPTMTCAAILKHIEELPIKISNKTLYDAPSILEKIPSKIDKVFDGKTKKEKVKLIAKILSWLPGFGFLKPFFYLSGAALGGYGLFLAVAYYYDIGWAVTLVNLILGFN